MLKLSMLFCFVPLFIKLIIFAWYETIRKEDFDLESLFWYWLDNERYGWICSDKTFTGLNTQESNWINFNLYTKINTLKIMFYVYWFYNVRLFIVSFWLNVILFEDTFSISVLEFYVFLVLMKTNVQLLFESDKL